MMLVCQKCAKQVLGGPTSAVYQPVY